MCSSILIAQTKKFLGGTNLRGSLSKLIRSCYILFQTTKNIVNIFNVNSFISFVRNSELQIKLYKIINNNYIMLKISYIKLMHNIITT